MVRVQICTCLELEMHKKIKESRWKVPELIFLGIKAKEDNPQLLSRIRELEGVNEKLLSKLQAHAKRLYEIESLEAIKQ